jgi:formylglycine-generating enzyme
MGRTTVTVAQWKQFAQETGYQTDGEKIGESLVPGPPGMGWAPKKGVSWRNPDYGTELRDDHPVRYISWNDALAFCDWLTYRERNAGRLPAGWVLRLPTEAEWEYACRAGTWTKFWWGDSLEDGRGRLNWGGTEDGYEFASPVNAFGTRGRNGFGLADMLGNVWQWCLDGFDTAQAHENIWTGNPDRRVLRGGSFGTEPLYCHCAYRIFNYPFISIGINGFRVAAGVAVPGVGNTASSSSPSATH